ncbi:hypothetical protein RI103_21560 [Paraburkholderia sp. FT54]|uniref:hypothetical protein n=1 Tax=Paraburkholderia sp. FT54 TaxID=3074437 RepID=UPI0028775360|nr:hypothetical protein [Paraburkholderia sp. FT54]WNC93395.1 hypothetical protein RI103_21560 [Paraburkholderia sp. FT54]
MSFHPSLLFFLGVGLCGMTVAGLLTIVVEKIGAALTSRHRTADTDSRTTSDLIWPATPR